MIETSNDIRRWTILDSLTNKIYDITDLEFSDGILSNIIKLRGQFVTVENNHKIWIDGIVKK